MFPEDNYSTQFLRKNIVKMKDFFTMCLQNWIQRWRLHEAYKESLSSCAPI